MSVVVVADAAAVAGAGAGAGAGVGSSADAVVNAGRPVQYICIHNAIIWSPTIAWLSLMLLISWLAGKGCVLLLMDIVDSVADGVGDIVVAVVAVIVVVVVVVY